MTLYVRAFIIRALGVMTFSSIKFTSTKISKRMFSLMSYRLTRLGITINNPTLSIDYIVNNDTHHLSVIMLCHLLCVPLS
jgi:hypothetical protein